VSDEHEEQVPGVTFWLVNSSLGASQGDEKYRVKLSLDCAVNDDELWQEVEKKFKEGFRIHTVPDFHVEVIDVMRAELKAAKERNIILERQVAQEQDRRKQVESELEQFRAPLGAFGRALRGG
jgi:hypothetical protein